MPGNRYMPATINSPHFTDEMCNSMLEKLEIVSPIKLNVFVCRGLNVQVTDKHVHAATDLTKMGNGDGAGFELNVHYDVHHNVECKCTS
jgi:hypothetical protein